MNDECEQQRERDEEREDREMKPERLEPVAELVVNCQQRRDQRPIRLIARERAEGCPVAEEERNVPKFANGRVGYDRVPVVSVERILKMV